MGRLIDADVLKSHIKAVIKKQNGGDIDLVPVGDLLTFIGREPTAYDVDAVVNELGKASSVAQPVGWSRKKEVVELNTAIEIVKGGGVDDNSN